MNTKKVKRLRKALGYHPKMVRRYNFDDAFQTLHKKDPRAIYQQTKRAMKNG